MKNPPLGWPQISSAVFYTDARAAIEWLCRVFGFELRLIVEGEGQAIEHCELACGSGVIMVGQQGHASRPEHLLMVSPRSTNGGNTQVLSVFVDDVDAHCARARSLGAEIFREPETSDYGPQYAMDRTYGVKDIDGHMWFFMQRVRDPGPA